MMPEYPQHEKLATVKDLSQEIGVFLDWLDEQDWHLGEWDENGFGEQELFLIRLNSNQILARFFEIDLDKLEEEKLRILEGQRELNKEVDQDKELAAVRAATEKLTEQYRDSLEDLADR